MDFGYFKHSQKVQTRDAYLLSVVSCGIQSCEKGHYWGYGVRDHFLLHIVKSGEGRLFYNQKSYKLKSGDMFLISPNVEVKYVASDDNPWHYAWVGFTGADAKMLLKETTFSKENPVLSFSEKERDSIYEEMSKIYSSMGNHTMNHLEVFGHFFLMFKKIVEIHQNKELGKGLAPLEEALRFIHQHYFEFISIPQIASSIGFSRSQLYRIFMANVGVSPSDYLTYFRLEKAKELLKNKNLSVSIISNSVGFSDPLYFSRVFKSAFKISPREFRKTL